jgi:hypothetical protein
MKNFVKNILIYLCFVFLVALAIQCIISFRISGKSISENDNLEQTSNVNADLVFLGSSRSSMHFDPKFFDENFKIKSVNIGVNGHSDIAMAIIRLKYYLSRNKQPKFAILNFDPFVYAGSILNNSQFGIKNEFSRFAFFPDNKDLLIVNYFKFNLSEKYIPLYSIFKYRQLRNCLFVKNNNDYKKYGYQIHDEHWDTIANPITLDAEKLYFKKNQIEPITNSLRELNELCLKKGIKLLCIQTPVYKSIYDKAAFSNTRKICKNINIPFLDVYDRSIIDNVKCFINSNHLNKYGVEQMNQFFIREKTLDSFLLL